MRHRTLSAAVGLTGLLVAGAAGAHEFWIEPERFHVEPGMPILAHLRNGEFFDGPPQAYFSSRVARSEYRQGIMIQPLAGRMGDLPAIQTDAPDSDGLLVVLHQTEPTTLTYHEWEKFEAFARHKDFPDIRARHLDRGLPEAGFIERYSRFAKSLVAVGDGQGSDAVTGMETEFIALANPYTDPLPEGLPVRLHYQGAPRADAQVEVFDRAPDGAVTVSLLRTDDNGETIVPLQAGHDYLLDAVVLRPAPEDGDAVWETLWASLTFRAPD